MTILHRLAAASVEIHSRPGRGKRQVIDTRYVVVVGEDMAVANFGSCRDAETYARGWRDARDAILGTTSSCPEPQSRKAHDLHVVS
jgi:hypothetical protein